MDGLPLSGDIPRVRPDADEKRRTTAALDQFLIAQSGATAEASGNPGLVGIEKRWPAVNAGVSGSASRGARDSYHFEYW